MRVEVFDDDCDCCGGEREGTAEEADYERALERLIVAARAVGRSRREVEGDLRDWWGWARIEEAAKQDPEVVRLWWVRGGHRSGVGS